MNKKQKLYYYGLYSILFFILAGAIVYFYYSKGNSLIDANGDGFRQHFRALLYYSHYLKHIFSNLLSGNLSIPQWDIVIGEGSDVLNSLHYYCVGDVFTFFSVLVPEKYMYLYYDFATICRMYCAGIGFSLLCFFHNKNNIYVVLTGALLYVFCPFAISNLSSHIFFLSAMVYFPFIILGVEKIIAGDKPFMLPIAVMLSSLSNIYFFYMNVLSTVVYTIVRLIFIDRQLKEKGLILLKVTIFSLTGLLMSAIVFMPMVFVMTSNARLESRVNIDLLYPISDYRNMFTGFVFGGYMFYGGYSLLGLFAIVKLFLNKGNNTLKTLFVIGTLFACIPFFGTLYNAMVSPTPRWLYAMALLLSYTIVEVFNDFKWNKTDIIIMTIVSLIYYPLCLYLDGERWQIHVMFMMLSLMFLLYLIIIKQRKFDSLLIMGIGLFAAAFIVIYYYSPRYWNFPSQGKSIASINEIVNDEHSIFNEIDDDSFYRYSGNLLTVNESVQGNHSSTQYYWSIVNDYIVNFRKQLGLSDHSNHHIDNYDDRYSLNMLSGVKYYVHKEKGIIPYSYESVGDINGYDVYKSDSSLSLVYAYDSYLDKQEWDKLSLAQRNEVLSQSAYIEKEIDLAKHNPVFENQDVDFELLCDEGLILGNGQINVSAVDVKARLKPNSLSAGEYYLVVEGLHSNLLSNIEILCGDIRKVLFFKGSDNLHFSDRHDYMINLGYANQFTDEVTLTFHDVGQFTYDSLRIVYQPMDKQEEYIRNLNDLKINSLTVDDKVIADVETDENKLLCFSLPYSKGWSAKVDGKKVEVLNCNIQYLGIYVEKGAHHIELSYTTPMVVPGAIISLLSSVGLLAYWLKVRSYNKIK